MENCIFLSTNQPLQKTTYTNFNIMTDTNTTSTLTETKVFNLCKEVDDLKRRKKKFIKEYNDEIKFIQKEIEELLRPEEKVDLP